MGEQGQEGQEGGGKLGKLRGLRGVGERLRKLTEEGWARFIENAAEGKDEAVETLTGKERSKGGEK